MAHTEILLLERMDNLGSEGDIIKVRPGYARNYLFPQKKAVPLSLANKKRLDALKIARAAREADELRDAQEIAGKLESLNLAIAVKTGSGGKLFGSVTVQQIIDQLEAKGFRLDKRHFHNFSPIKTLGPIAVRIDLLKDVSAELKVEVLSENPIEQDI